MRLVNNFFMWNRSLNNRWPPTHTEVQKGECVYNLNFLLINYERIQQNLQAMINVFGASFDVPIQIWQLVIFWPKKKVESNKKSSTKKQYFFSSS